MIRSTIFLLLLLSSSPVVFGQQKAPPLRLRMVPISHGLAYNAKNGDYKQTKIYELAKTYSVNLSRPSHPLIAHRLQDQRLFSVFYTTLDNALGDRPYVIQRVKKTETFVDLEGNPRTPHVKYLVEVFKTNAGAIKGLDQHYGGHALGRNQSREIVKELEIGYGEIPNFCEGKTWPFEQGKLYKLLQNYGGDESMYESVRFHKSIKWTIRASLDKDGNYQVSSPELKFDLPEKKPPKEIAVPWNNPDSRRVVLTAGKGCSGIRLGKSTGRDIQRAFGKPLEVVAVTPTSTNYSYTRGITIQVKNGNQMSSLFTRSSFAGRTAKGIRLGDKKTKVRKAYGKPKGKANEWQYRGIVFRFDASERVKSIFVFES